jgi:antitoxin VapB
MKKAKIFKNGQSQAVRLPKEFKFSGKEVWIKRSGGGVLLLPVDRKEYWQSLRSTVEKFSSDFMPERNQPEWTDSDRDLFG